jgi:hypothetical protein
VPDDNPGKAAEMPAWPERAKWGHGPARRPDPALSRDPLALSGRCPGPGWGATAKCHGPS